MIVIDNILDVEKHIDGLNAVIFDLDDTLYSEKEYVRCGYRRIADYFGKKMLAEQMWAVFKRGGRTIDEVLEANSLEAHKEEALHIYRFQEPEIHLYLGVAQMLKRIRRTKKVGIITDVVRKVSAPSCVRRDCARWWMRLSLRTRWVAWRFVSPMKRRFA